MGKRLLIVAALLALIAVPAFAAVQNVKVGGELRFRSYMRHTLDLDDKGGATDDQQDYMEQRARMYIAADLNENVSTFVRIQNNRYWGDAEGTATGVDDMDVENAYVKLGDVLNTMGLASTPLDIYLGRQDLAYGKKMLIGGGNPHEAIRMVWGLDPWTVDIFLSKITETYAAVPNSCDNDLLGIYASYAGIENWTFQPYIIGQSDKTAETATAGSSRRRTFGMLIMGDPIEDLNFWVEPAFQRGCNDVPQTGNNGAREIKAWAIWTGAKYTFSDVNYTPWAQLQYAYASGDNKAGVDMEDNTFNQVYSDIGFGNVADPSLSNLHVIGASAGLQLTDDLKAKIDYYHYRQAAKVDGCVFDGAVVDNLDNTTSSKLGNEVDITLDYQYTEDVATQLYWSYFDPGKAFSDPRDDAAYMVRGQLEVKF